MRSGRGLAIGLAIGLTVAAGSIAAASVVSIRDADRQTGTFSPLAPTGATGTGSETRAADVPDPGATAPAPAASTGVIGGTPVVGAPATRTTTAAAPGAPTPTTRVERPTSVDPVVTTTTEPEDHEDPEDPPTTSTTEPDDD